MNPTPLGAPIDVPPALLATVRDWLTPVRAALGGEFASATLTGSVLRPGFDPKRSRINVVVVARSLAPEALDRLRLAMPVRRHPPHIEPLLVTPSEVEQSLDTFPIEWLDIKRRHLVIEGEDVFAALEVRNDCLRLQCEHELRAKHLRLRQAYLASDRRPRLLEDALRASASSFATLFRTLIRLRGESPPAATEQVIDRVAELFRLDGEALRGAHRVRHAVRHHRPEEIVETYRRFLAEISRLVVALDQLPVP